MRLLTVAEAAERARVSPLTIRRRIKSGVLAATKPGGAYLIREDDLERHLASGAT